MTLNSSYRTLITCVMCTTVCVAAVALWQITGQQFRYNQYRSCASNLRSIGGAFNLYAADWDDCLPNSGTWCDVVLNNPPRDPNVALESSKQSEAVLRCPAVPQFGYAMNIALSGKTRRVIGDNSVMIFEANSSAYNATGSIADLTATRHSNLNCLLSNGKVVTYNQYWRTNSHW